MSSGIDLEENQLERTRSSRKKVIIIVAVAIALLLACIGGYYLWNTNKASKDQKPAQGVQPSAPGVLKPHILSRIKSFGLKNSIKPVSEGNAALAISNEGKQTVAITGEKEVTVFDKDGEKTHKLDLTKNDAGTLHAVGISPDGTRVICAYLRTFRLVPFVTKYRAYIYTQQPDGAYVRETPDKELYLNHGSLFRFSPDNKFLLASGGNNKEHYLKDLTKPNSGAIKVSSVDNENIICFTNTRLFFVDSHWNSSGVNLESYDLSAPNKPQVHEKFSNVDALHVSSDQKSLIVCRIDSKAKVLNLIYYDITLEAKNVLKRTNEAKVPMEKSSNSSAIITVITDEHILPTKVILDTTIIEITKNAFGKAAFELSAELQGKWPKVCAINNGYTATCESSNGKSELVISKIKEMSDQEISDLESKKKATLEAQKKKESEAVESGETAEESFVV